MKCVYKHQDLQILGLQLNKYEFLKVVSNEPQLGANCNDLFQRFNVY